MEQWWNCNSQQGIINTLDLTQCSATIKIAFQVLDLITNWQMIWKFFLLTVRPFRQLWPQGHLINSTLIGWPVKPLTQFTIYCEDIHTTGWTKVDWQVYLPNYVWVDSTGSTYSLPWLARLSYKLGSVAASHGFWLGLAYEFVSQIRVKESATSQSRTATDRSLKCSTRQRTL